MTETLRERLKQSFLFYNWYLFLRNRFRLVAWLLKGRPSPPPPLVKQLCVLAYQRKFGIPILVETGTYRGEMVRAMSAQFQKIYSIELSPELYQKAKETFSSFPHIHLLQGDSTILLPHLLQQISEPCLFWLDAHYSGEETARGNSETPIMAELECILRHPSRRHAILIDDARCFDGRNGYPELEDLKKLLFTIRPSWSMAVHDDIICIHPAQAP